MNTMTAHRLLREEVAAGVHPNDRDERPVDVRPYLTIPYWPPVATDVGDTGQVRP